MVEIKWLISLYIILVCSKKKIKLLISLYFAALTTIRYLHFLNPGHPTFPHLKMCELYPLGYLTNKKYKKY